MKLNIIHTNDIHSHFENFARVTSFIKHNSDEQTLILDGGDFADFKSIELQGTKGLAAVKMLESAGYEALTIGNNELFNGTDTLEYMALNSSVPFISCNLLKSNGDSFEGVRSSIILHKNGLRILLTGASPDLREFNELMGFQINDYKGAIQKEITKHQNQYDICIVLNHIGTELDIELAEAIDEIDLILSAHDHVLYEEAKVVNGTILNSAGMYGEHVGIVEMEYRNGSLKLLASSTISTSKATEDEKIKCILASSKEEAIAHLSKPIYSVDTPLWHDVIEENPLTNLIADGLKDRFQCEIGIINSGIVNGGLVHFLSNKKLIEICPSPLNPTYFEIKGKHLKLALESSLDSAVCMADGRGPGFRGKYAGRLHVSGIEVFHNGASITSLTVNGEMLEPDRWYKVASSDYLLRGSGYPNLAHNRNFSYEPDEIRDVIREYANQERFVKSAFKNRWFLKNSVISNNRT